MNNGTHTLCGSSYPTKEIREARRAIWRRLMMYRMSITDWADIESYESVSGDSANIEEMPPQGKKNLAAYIQK